MKRILIVFFMAALAAAGFGGGVWYTRNAPPKKTGRRILYWVDPMHPAYTSDKPGIAPDCGMQLEPVYAEDAPSGSAKQTERKILYWVDSMNPAFKSPKPGVAPDGMDLVPVYEDGPSAAAALPAGTLDVSAEQQQLLGVTFAKAALSSIGETVSAVGKVAVDETRITRVHPKIDGWISQVNVDFVGQVVKQGDPLLTLYSPEMVATEQELLLALRARDQMRNSHNHDAVENSDALVDASRRRLDRWEMSPAQIEELERTRTVIRSVTLYSPAAGYVMARNAFPSQKVTPETELYALADLSHAWILADVFETDLAKIRLGQTAWVSSPNAGGPGFAARVDYVQPQVDPVTRTVKIRLDAPNADLRLKPDLFVNVEFHSGGAARVMVPADAVVNTGTRQTVFVDQGNGRLEARDVEMGDRIGDRTQILRGLKAGERVVASGTFLIDSEAQLKKGLGHD